jgi:hypothetical protein
MNISVDTTIRRVRLFLAAGASLVAVFAGSALAADRPAASFYTPQQLKAMSDNWAAKGRLLGSPDAASFYTREQLQAMSANWAAKGRLLGNTDWAAIGRLLQESSPVRDGNSGKLAWSDFGIGAGAMLGAVLLAVGLGAAIHYGRRGGVRTRPV